MWGVTSLVDGGVRYSRVLTQCESCPLWRASAAHAGFPPVGRSSPVATTTTEINSLSPGGANLEGTRLLDLRVAKTDFHVISEGSALITWRDIRLIRASFPTNAQTLYRLKSNSFLLWNWAKQDRSCLGPGCVNAGPALASHIFWACPSAPSLVIPP